ncbi:alpha-D-ribose 1-methylphosphonate 5-triphosphate diphosphatase [Acuticoccus sp. M5D2P5]|uniref:alpha-D-ribose 1-methylphosphonate 5-triphosphate diphosphatase n=1 Tax=Acuticoccus kalidii TaxID=2910977 RepID=UPI001F2557C5|nr:alpha-D-ribose 1-methylphosphonate 5-triphosphate diphosphatase [Acuticoccus kalidii]MCF3936620.1 alpha-D-ribose 1-methylphosphonate 5-triphosphate diphosphatase [Acuticoccus kalidii]
MWLSDFTLVLPDRTAPNGAVRIEAGRIVEVRERPVEAATYRGGGRLLMPGFVDIHGDMVEREVEPRPGVRMPLDLSILEHDKKLAAAGVTTAYASLSFNPASPTTGKLRSEEMARQLIETIVAMRAELLIDHRIHTRFEVTFAQASAVVADLMRRGAVDLVSLMDHTPGQGQYRDIETYAAYIANARGISMEEAHADLRRRMDDGAAAAGATTATIAALTATAAEHGIAIASHDDDTAQKVALMRDFGATISEFPVTLEAAREAKRAGMWTAMGAPNALRGLSYSGNLSARELHALGMLDILAADYHPAAFLPSVFLMAEIRGGLPVAASLASLNPARAAGLDDRGAIAVGQRADLVVAEPSPRPRLRATFSAGRMVYGDGTLVPERQAVPTLAS